MNFIGRMSTDENDPGYAAWLNRGNNRVNVFINGVEQRDCSTVDTVEGIVVRCKHDKDGKIYCVGDEIAIETVKGEVRVELVEETR
jgi:hypothetical protein